MKYEKRPFGTTEEMDAHMIKQWNNIVSKKDTIIHAGDFAFAGAAYTRELVSQLNGYKILVLGNHDIGRTVTWWREAGFNEVSKYPICVDEFFWISHAPMYLTEDMPYVNCHGHLHSKMQTGANYFNLCVENNGFSPISLDAIKAKFAVEVD